MSPQESLLSSLYTDVVDPEELSELVLETFGFAAYESEKEVVYHRPGEPVALRFLYSGDKIRQIEMGPGLSSTDISDIQAKIQTDLLDPSKKIVGRAILLSDCPVSGYYKHEHSLQICPPPEHAVKPKWAWEGGYPFLIEFQTYDSPNFAIRLNRISSSANRIFLFINSLSDVIIRPIPTPQRHVWVVRNEGGSLPERLQETYSIPGFQPWQDNYTEYVSAGKIDLVPHKEYFTRYGWQPGRPLQLPDTFDKLFSIYRNLSKPAQDKFVRAGYWYSLAQNQHSLSARFLHLIQCIETLVPNAESSQSCEKCGKDLGKGPTKRFVDFLDDLVPEHPDLAKERSQFYRLRSDLSHGWDLFTRDLRMAKDPKSTDQMMYSFKAYKLASIALVNWLTRQAQTATPSQASSALPLA